MKPRSGDQAVGEWRSRLAPGLAALGVILPPGAEVKLLAFTELLLQWNQAYNLTAVRDPAEVVTKHLLDSLAVLPFVAGSPVLDVGTGAGLPGIPLALALQDSHFVLLDSNGKKTRFITHAAAVLPLPNVTAVQARIEDYRPEAPFATVLSRAFASLGDFVGLAGHVCAPGGRLLAMKGTPEESELARLPAGYRVAGVHPLKVPGLDAERCVVEIRKEGN